MTYAQDVASQRAGDAIELYRFDAPQVTYAYTSGTRAYTYDGNTYAPLAGLRRSARGSSSSADRTNLEIEMIGACDLVSAYGYTTPPRSLRLRVYEVQRVSGEVALLWDGDAVACSPVGSIAKFRSTSLLAERMATAVPWVQFSSMCNHRLGDDRCTIDLSAAGRHHEPVVSSISSDGYTITVDSIGAFADQAFKSGLMVRDADGEARTIVDQVGAVLKIASPFRVIAAGNALSLTVGCAHTIDACLDDFNNVANFGGHPAMAASNPFAMNVRLLADS